MRWALRSRPAWSDPRWTRMAVSLSDGSVEPLGYRRQGFVGRVEHLRVAPEAVDHPCVLDKLHLRAGNADPSGELTVLVGQHVVLGDRDVRRWGVAEVLVEV